ncbi:MAG: hypothetical protein DELT_02813 [Desulfovibrio sp.]
MPANLFDPDELELPEDVQEALDEICEQGNEAMDENDPEEALAFFRQAVDILPEPAEKWEAYSWLCAAQGDAQFGMQDFTGALEQFREAYNLSDPDEVNPFVLLRLGQCFLRLGDEKNAAEYLLRAYMLEGEEIFEDDEDDFTFLKKAVPLDK